MNKISDKIVIVSSKRNICISLLAVLLWATSLSKASALIYIDTKVKDAAVMVLEVPLKVVNSVFKENTSNVKEAQIWHEKKQLLGDETYNIKDVVTLDLPTYFSKLDIDYFDESLKAKTMFFEVTGTRISFTSTIFKQPYKEKDRSFLAVNNNKQRWSLIEKDDYLIYYNKKKSLQVELEAPEKRFKLRLFAPRRFMKLDEAVDLITKIADTVEVSQSFN